MKEQQRYYSVADLLYRKAAKQLEKKVNDQLSADPSLAGIEGVTNARLKPGAEWKVSGLSIWLPEPVETPLRIDQELMKTARPEFTPYGMMYKPYARDAVIYNIKNSPAPMTAEMEAALDVVIEAYDKNAINDQGLVQMHTAHRKLILYAHLDMDSVTLKLGELQPYHPLTESPDKIYLNEYLLPKYWDAAADDILALRILLEFMPECVHYQLPLDGYELVRRMGLRLVWKLLKPDFSVLGEIFDVESRTEIIEVHSREANDNFIVDPGMILLDDRLKTGNHYPMEAIYSTLVHECVHWYKDRMYSALQRVFTPQAHLSVCRNSPAAHRSSLFERDSDNDLNTSIPSSLMEAQALAIPPHILINARSGRKKVAEIVQGYGGQITEENYYSIIDDMRSFFGVTRYAADKRLREFGYKIPRLHSSSRRFSYKHHSEPETVYDIPFDRIVELNDEEKYPAFCRSLRTGKYIYADYRLCLNEKEYIEYDKGGTPHLTGRARSHPEECCLPFQIGGINDPDLSTGAMATSRPKGEFINRIPQPDPHIEEGKDKFQRDYALLCELAPLPLGKEMDYHRRHPYQTYEQWSNKSFVSERGLKNMCKDPVKPKPEFRTFLRAVLGLQLDPFFSKPLMDKAKYPPLEEEAHNRLVDSVLQTFYVYPILEIHRLMYAYGFHLIEEAELAKEQLDERGELMT